METAIMDYGNPICPYMGGCQNYGPFLGPYYTTAPNIQGTQKGTIILTTIHITHYNMETTTSGSGQHVCNQRDHFTGKVGLMKGSRCKVQIQDIWFKGLGLRGVGLKGGARYRQR